MFTIERRILDNIIAIQGSFLSFVSPVLDSTLVVLL